MGGNIISCGNIITLLKILERLTGPGAEPYQNYIKAVKIVDINSHKIRLCSVERVLRSLFFQRRQWSPIYTST